MYNVLYIDDDPVLLDLCTRYLNIQWGISVNPVISPEEALLKLKTETFDAIISDYEMPVMDGISFLKHLREENCTLPFILFTGKSREEVIIEALNCGADYYLQKGGNPKAQFSELVNMIGLAVEKGRAEKELDRAHCWSSTIINHLPDPTFVVDNNGTIISWNLAMEKITGLIADEAIGNSAEEIFYQIYGVNNIALVYAVLNPEFNINVFHDNIEYNGNTITAETFFKDKSGREHYLWVKVSQIFDDNMHISGVIETVRNIKKIKHTENILKETAQQLQNIIDFIPDPTFVIDNQGKVIAWNHAMEDLTSVCASSMIGQGDYSYAEPFYGNKRPVLIDFVFKENEDIIGKYNFFKKEGDKIIAETFVKRLQDKEDVYLWGVSAPLYDTNGAITGAIETIRDISERKKLELELNQKYEELVRLYEEIAAQNEEIKASFGEVAERELQLVKSERKFRGLVEHLPIGIIMHNKDRIKYTNPTAIKLLGYDNSNELIGMKPLNILCPDRRENIKQRITDSNKSQTEFINEIFLKKDGTEIPVEIAGISILIDDVKANMTIFRDISTECNRRTTLRQATKKLDILTSITQHDIMNQATVLITTLDLMLEESQSESASSLLKTANISCKNIIDSIRIYKEYQSLGLKEPRWFYLKSIINQVIRKSHVSDIISYSSVDVEIYADPLIEKIFENLIDNSIRHGGEISKILIYTGTTPDDLYIIYHDDGYGIPDEDKEKVFIKGYGENTGLGLFLIKEILSVTGITIRECGKAGKGVMFEMRVPHKKWRYHQKEFL